MVTLTHRGRRRLLLATNAALAAAILACAAAAVLVPLDAEAPRDNGRAGAPTTAPAVGAVGPRSAYAVIYGRDLRKPLHDAPPPGPAPAPPKPKFLAMLVGTAVEPGFTYGVFRTAGGQDKLVSPGERIEGAELVAVRDGQADIRFNGEIITLKVQPREVR